MTSKLSLYNGALREVGGRKLASLAENRESRRVLDSMWDADAVKTCLAAGQWNFAMRTQRLDFSPSIAPEFGYARAFVKPDDWVRTCAVCEDEFFRMPLLDYNDEAGYWFSDLDVIFVRFVSDDTDYGLDYSKWPANFTRYVESFLAARICMKLTGNATKREQLERDAEVWLVKAKSSDAMDEATAKLPAGSWSRARHSNGRASDRGNRNRLIG